MSERYTVTYLPSGIAEYKSLGFWLHDQCAHSLSTVCCLFLCLSLSCLFVSVEFACMCAHFWLFLDVWVCMHMCIQACGGLRWVSGIILDCVLPSYSLKQGLSIEPKAIGKARLLASLIWELRSHLQGWNYRQTAMPTQCCMASQDKNPISHAWTACTLTTEPSPQPPNCFWKILLASFICTAYLKSVKYNLIWPKRKSSV